MIAVRFLSASVAISFVLWVLPGRGQGQGREWESLLRVADWGGEVLEAPEGYQILAAPAPDAPVVRTVAGPAEVVMARYVEIGEARYYLTEDQSNLVWDGGTPQWISIPGTERASFIRETTPAQLIKRETRDFFKTGPQTAEVYEETVSLAAVTEWGPEYRRAELDFRLPVKVREVRRNPDDSWEATFTVFPAFDSNVSRIPGKRPENWGEPYEVLMTRAKEREVRLRGPGDGERFAALLLPETVWAAEISEGRIQGLRVGYHDLQPPLEVSRLSAPEFVSGREMAFRFSVSRLLADPLVFTVKPDRVTGVDGTYYQGIALLGGPKTDPDEAAGEKYLHSLWNMTLSPDLTVRVVTPLLDGRGAAGMLELESLGLGPSFEEELKALSAMKTAEPPLLTPAEEGGWISIFAEPLGFVPAAQRDPETQY